MASYGKKHGKWQARISWRRDGKRYFKSKQGFATKSLAQSWAIDEEAKLNQGLKINDNTTFADYFKRWYETYKQPKISRITQNRYNLVYKHIKQYFKNTSIKTITRQEYQQFINNYGSTHAPASVRKLNSITRACVKSAILDDYIRKDFTQNVTLTSNKSKEIKVEYLNIKEIKALANEIKASANGHRYTSRYMILLAIYTGMRLSEIQALTWNDIDFMHNTISITKSWDAINKKFKPTKNKSSVRTIKVNPTALQFIGKLRFGSKSNMVFRNQFGSIPTSNAVNSTLRHLLDRLNIHRKNFHFHSLRHSHVALLLANGIDIYAISKRLGHSNTTTTSEVYAYLIDEYKVKTDDKIVKVLEKI